MQLISLKRRGCHKGVTGGECHPHVVYCTDDGSDLRIRRTSGMCRNVMYPGLERLNALTPSPWGGGEWNTFFDPIGLVLQLPPTNWEYWCTPKNSLTFATTSGDGT